YKRDLELRMGVEHSIEACRAAVVRSVGHEIGLCRSRQRPLFFAIISGARVKWPSPMHLSIMLCPVPKTQECEFGLLSSPIDDRRGNTTIRAMSMPRSLEPLTVRIALHGRPVWFYPEPSL